MFKAKAFTLVELLVVIIIMGLLASLAIPRLFDLSTKSKFSEIPIAVASYERFQQAYNTETSKLGAPDSIQWGPPGSLNVDGSSQTQHFKYVATPANGAPNLTTGSASIVVENHVKLGSCNLGSVWSGGVNINGSLVDRVKPSSSCGNYLPNF